MRRHVYRCSKAVLEILPDTEPEVVIETPTGYIPPPFVEVHRPRLQTIVYYAVGMYSPDGLA